MIALFEQVFRKKNRVPNYRILAFVFEVIF